MVNVSIVIGNDLNELCKTVAPLYHKYPGQHEPQGAYLELECGAAKTGRVTAGWNGECGNAVPAPVYHGHDRRYGVNPCVSGAALADLLESAELQALLRRVVEGYENHWDGNNHVARLTDDALAAEEEIRELIAEEINEFSGVAEVWDVADWLFSSCCLLDHWSNQPIEEAVAELEFCIEANQYVDGDIEETLIEEAKNLAENEDWGKLTATHFKELVRRGEITDEQVRRIEEDPLDAAEWLDEGVLLEFWDELPAKETALVLKLCMADRHRITGDLEGELLAKAKKLVENKEWTFLKTIHIEELLKRKEITEDQAAEWEREAATFKVVSTWDDLAYQSSEGEAFLYGDAVRERLSRKQAETLCEKLNKEAPKCDWAERFNNEEYPTYSVEEEL